MVCCGQPKKEDIEFVLNCLVEDSFNECFQKIIKLQREKGIALQDVITQLHLVVHKIKFPIQIKMNIIEKLSNIE